MGYTNTSITGTPVPDNKENLNQAWKFAGNAVNKLETYVVMSFASMSDLTAKLVGDKAPRKGMVAYLVDQGLWYGYNGTTWVKVSIGQPFFYSGSAAPASNLGSVGDIYIQY